MSKTIFVGSTDIPEPLGPLMIALNGILGGPHIHMFFGNSCSHPEIHLFFVMKFQYILGLNLCEIVGGRFFSLEGCREEMDACWNSTKVGRSLFLITPLESLLRNS